MLALERGLLGVPSLEALGFPLILLTLLSFPKPLGGWDYGLSDPSLTSLVAITFVHLIVRDLDYLWFLFLGRYYKLGRELSCFEHEWILVAARGWRRHLLTLLLD